MSIGARFAPLLYLALAHAGLPSAEEAADVVVTQPSAPVHQAFLSSLVGDWEGTSRTWFEPGKLADESALRGSIRPVLDGRFVRHEYAGSIRGKPRRGEETIAFNAVSGRFQIGWVDDFHMNYAIMFSEGDPRPGGFSVSGTYDVAPGVAPWGWRTEYQLLDPDHLRITAWNVTPDGLEAKAIETEYTRVRH